MFTVTFVLYEKDGMDRAEALRYWREQHGALVRRVPNVRRYLQQHAVSAPGGPPPFLGVASLYFDSEDDWKAASRSEEMGTAVADVANFASTELPTAFVEDVWIVE